MVCVGVPQWPYSLEPLLDLLDAWGSKGAPCLWLMPCLTLHLGAWAALRSQLRALSMAALCPGSLGQGWLSGNLFLGSEAQPYPTAAVCLSCNSQTRRREASSSLLRSCLAKGKRRAPCFPGRNQLRGRGTLPGVPAMRPSLQMRRPWKAI